MKKQYLKAATRLIVLLLVAMMVPIGVFAQEAKETKETKEVNASVTKKKIETIKIKTSAICGMCKDRLEHNMAFEKGVTFVELDDKTKVLTVKYKTKKTNPEKLKKAITMIGYDADDMLANKEAHDKLPACCQKGNEPH